MPMTSRERVLSVINHEQPDRVPLVIGVSNATGIKMQPYRGIKDIIGVRAPDKYLYDWPELGTAAVDEATLRRLHSDVRGVLDLEPESIRRKNRERDPHSDFIDSWGSGQSEVEPGEWYPGVHPLPDARTVADLDAYPGWPDMLDPTRVAHVKATARCCSLSNVPMRCRVWRYFCSTWPQIPALPVP
jgi:uroporphyrinogen decarboxylase